MKFIILASILISSCASINSNLRNLSGLNNEAVKNTFVQAQELFIKTTKCQIPKNDKIYIYDVELDQLNRGRNIFVGRDLAIIIGNYNDTNNSIFLFVRHPDRIRILFHEFLHYLFVKSPNCKWAESPNIQHTIIPLMEKEYFNNNKKMRDIGNQWLIDALETYGIRLNKER